MRVDCTGRALEALLPEHLLGEEQEEQEEDRGMEEQVRRVEEACARVTALKLGRNSIQRLDRLVRIDNEDAVRTKKVKTREGRGGEKKRSRVWLGLSAFPSLVTLLLGNNSDLRRVPASELAPSGASLRALVLNNNALADLHFLSATPVLQTLVVSQNRLTDEAMPPADAWPTTLEKLSATHNHLTRVPNMAQCERLHELRMAHNRVSEWPLWLGAADAPASQSVKILDLGHNALKDLPAACAGLGGLPALTHLNLAGNPLAATETTQPDVLKTLDRKTAATLQARRENYTSQVPQSAVGLIVWDGTRIQLKRSHMFRKKREQEQHPPSQPEGLPEGEESTAAELATGRGSETNGAADPTTRSTTMEREEEAPEETGERKKKKNKQKTQKKQNTRTEERDKKARTKKAKKREREAKQTTSWPPREHTQAADANDSDEDGIDLVAMMRGKRARSPSPTVAEEKESEQPGKRARVRDQEPPQGEANPAARPRDTGVVAVELVGDRKRKQKKVPKASSKQKKKNQQQQQQTTNATAPTNIAEALANSEYTVGEGGSSAW